MTHYRTIIGKRPVVIPREQVDRAQQPTSNGNQLIGADWTIWNAPRPIVGNVEWRGDFVSGVFYAATDPHDERTAWMMKTNEEQNAVILRYVTMAEVRRAVAELYMRDYPEVGESELAEANDSVIADSYYANGLDRD